MKIKWRQHEMILATAVILMITISYAWNIWRLSPETINVRYANVFKEMHVPFNLFRNVILPDVSSCITSFTSLTCLLIYLQYRVYCFRKNLRQGLKAAYNTFKAVISCWFQKKYLKKYAWLLIQIILIVLILAIAFDIATYFSHEWQFHYPGFSIFFNKNNPHSQLGLSAGFFAAATMHMLCMAYM